MTVKANKPSPAEGINGGWLVSVVAAQSVAVLGAQLSSGFAASHVLFYCLIMWRGGKALISGSFRWSFTVLRSSRSTGLIWRRPYGINTGAVAISTLAGTMLIAVAPHCAVLTQLLPFLKGSRCW